MKLKISLISRVLLIVSTLAMVLSLFVPIWSIYLDAPQYPEGLQLEIWANKIAGDVDIINGLNHYIGMRTIHSDDFVEFRVLPYIIGLFGILFLVTAVVANRRLLNIVFALFIVFGVVSMIDFWLWEYDYGHNLDPNAAIKVPGMAYQPPLIGFKQLLNFGAYSIPDIGGWSLIGTGALLFFTVMKENRIKKLFKSKNKVLSIVICTFLLFVSCNGQESQPINLNKDACHYCKMSISDGRFATEIITNKGRVYKFDDIRCMMDYKNSPEGKESKSFYSSDFSKNNSLINARTAWYIKSDELRSPMNGNIASFPTKELASQFAQKYNTETFSWEELLKIYLAKQKKHNEH